MDDFDRYCNWSRKPNDFMKQYHIHEMGSYEILDSDNEPKDKTVSDNGSLKMDSLVNSSSDIRGIDRSSYKVRSFKRTNKGYINSGDRFKSTSSVSLNIFRNHSVHTCSSQYLNPSQLNCCQTNGLRNSNPRAKHKSEDYIDKDDGIECDVDDDSCSDRMFSISNLDQTSLKQFKLEDIDEVTSFCVDLSHTFSISVIGMDNVGKTSLCEQVLSSDCVNVYDIDSQDEAVWNVTVDLDDKEWHLMFQDKNNFEQTDLKENPPDMLLIMYSIENQESFDWCTKFLKDNLDSLSPVAIFIVGNKSDLERLRQISLEKGKRLAEIYDAEFVEVSIILNHLVDNLLIQLIKKIKSHKKQLRRFGSSKFKGLIKEPKKTSPGDFFVNIFRKISKAF